jgi:hypothetical protein
MNLAPIAPSDTEAFACGRLERKSLSVPETIPFRIQECHGQMVSFTAAGSTWIIPLAMRTGAGRSRNSTLASAGSTLTS